MKRKNKSENGSTLIGILLAAVIVALLFWNFTGGTDDPKQPGGNSGGDIHLDTKAKIDRTIDKARDAAAKIEAQSKKIDEQMSQLE